MFVLLLCSSPQAVGQELFSASGAKPAPAKRALIIAIGDYPEPGIYGYSKINAANDVDLMKTALRSQGFQEGDIHVLRDSDATRQGILDAFRLYLLDASSPDDIVALHYSGHGHRITDDNGDELDGYDEVLVPFGAPGFPREDYAGEKHLRDDTLNQLLTELRERLGPNGHVFVSIDACFSGSATRARYELPVRGVQDPLGPPSHNRGTSSGNISEVKTTAARGGATDRSLASMVVLSATRHDELDHEVRDTDGTPVGPLSLALKRVMPLAREGMTYFSFFEQIRLSMASLSLAQSPQIEGDVDGLLFRGELAAHEQFVRVLSVSGDTAAVIGAGMLVGVSPGALISFFSLSGAADAPPIAQGIVNTVDDVTAVVLVPVLAGNTDLIASKAFVSEYSYGELELRVQADTSAADDFLAQAVTKLPNVLVVDDSPDLVLGYDRDTRGFALRMAAEDVAISGSYQPGDPADVESLADKIKAVARNRFLRGVSLSEASRDVRLELVPATHRYDSRGNCIDSDTTQFGAVNTPSGWSLRPDDGYLLRVTNVGTLPAYVAALSLPADGDVDQLFPHPYSNISDNIVEAGRSYLIDLCYSAAEPFGDEVLKLFATRDHVDFRPMLSAGGKARSGERLGTLQQMLSDAFSGTRSAVAGRADGSGSTHAITIKVVNSHEK